MTDLLTPDEVRRLLIEAESGAKRLMESTKGLKIDFSRTVLATSPRLCRDYLTLWEKYEGVSGRVDSLRDVLHGRCDILTDAINTIQEECNRKHAHD